jgi:transcriptional regulator with XRE-family HTH domain
VFKPEQPYTSYTPVVNICQETFCTNLTASIEQSFRRCYDVFVTMWWEQVKSLAAERQISPAQLARLSNLSESYIYRIFRGQVSGNPSVQTVDALARALSVDPAVITGTAPYNPAKDLERREDLVDELVRMAPGASRVLTRELIEAVLQLPPDKKRLLAELIESWGQAYTPEIAQEGAGAQHEAAGS